MTKLLFITILIVSFACMRCLEAHAKVTKSKELTKNHIKSKNMIVGFGSGSISYIVTDPDNRKVGYDSIKKIYYNEIPEVIYYKEGIKTPAGVKDYGFEETVRFTHMTAVKTGTYKVQIFGISTGPYSLDFRTYDFNGDDNGKHLFKGTIEKGAILNFIFTHSDKPKPYPY